MSLGKAELLVYLKANIDDLQTKMGAAGRNVDTFATGTESRFAKMGGAVKGLLGAAVAGFAFDRVLSFGTEMLNMNAQLTAIATKTTTVFEDQAGSVRKWADKNNESFGLTDDQLTGLAANFGDLLKPMGFTATQAADMSKDVIGLAGALSAWSGGTKSAADVSQVLAKAMLGERDGLKELGISITENDVSARLLAKGQKDLTGAALEQAKAIATQELIFEKSTDAQKAWAEGGNKALMMSNRFKAGIGELKEQLATKLGPVILTVGQALLSAFTRVSDWVSAHKEDINAFIHGLGEAFTVAWHIVEPILLNIWHRIQALWSIFSGVIDLIVDLANGRWSEVWEDIKKIVGGVVDGIWAFFLELPGKLVGALVNLALDIGGEFFKVGVQAVKGFIQGVKNTITGGGGIGDYLASRSGTTAVPVPQPAYPLLAEGGTVLQTGLAVVHQGEHYSGVGADRMWSPGGNAFNVTINVNGSGKDTHAIARAVRDELLRIGQRTGSALGAYA